MSLHTEATSFANGILDSTCGDSIKNLTSGADFFARIETNLDPFTIPESLGNDPRPKIRLHISNDSYAKKINLNDLITFNLFGSPVTFKIVSGFVDASSPTSVFYAIGKLPIDQ